MESTKQKIQLRPYQEAAVKAVEQEWADGNGKTLLVLPTGCHAKNEQLLKADGHLAFVQNIKVGDQLLGPDGTPRTVLCLHRGVDHLYRITPEYGNPFVVNGKHQLSLVHAKYAGDVDRKLFDMSVEDYLLLPDFAQKNLRLLHAKAIPTFQGRTERSYPSIYDYGAFISAKNEDNFVTGISDASLHAPLAERKQLLAGILDGDEFYQGGQYTYETRFLHLTEDLAFLCRSMGILVKMQFADGIFTLQIQMDRISADGNFTLDNRSRKDSFTVEKLGMDKYYGFTVDGDNRYLLPDFTITHNCGKTICFAKIAEHAVEAEKRVLILAHRKELLNQASDKIKKACGLDSFMELGKESCLKGETDPSIVISSMQTLSRESRLEQFPRDYFDVIIVDEAHHVLSNSYQTILKHFPAADVLGVTATPDRGDMRNLGTYFESLAYEYSLKDAIKEGYLSQIKALTIPLQIDISNVHLQSGDFASGEVSSALEPYLEQIAAEMERYCKDRKTVVFLPLVKTSKLFMEILNRRGVFSAAEVDGASKDRDEILMDFEDGKYNVLLNSMLLTEGWDCPEVDCIIMLRPTKSRSLYSQAIGRGTRLFNGKEDLLILDFLWLTERHRLCHPASLVSDNEKQEEKMVQKLSEFPGHALELNELKEAADEELERDVEEALRKRLAALRNRKRKFVDPLQFYASIQQTGEAEYQPTFRWEEKKPTRKQLNFLTKQGIDSEEVKNKGQASRLITLLITRQNMHLTTPRQIRLLERYGFQHVGRWSFDDASQMIDVISKNAWKVPKDIYPPKYKP